MNKVFDYYINEDCWKIYLIDNDDDVVEDDDTEAICKFHEKEMYFRESCTQKIHIILHELWHVYWGYLYLDNAVGISLHNIEEITATMFADKSHKIMQKGKEIQKKLIELYDEKE
jgi:hypothetical protein